MHFVMHQSIKVLEIRNMYQSIYLVTYLYYVTFIFRFNFRHQQGVSKTQHSMQHWVYMYIYLNVIDLVASAFKKQTWYIVLITNLSQVSFSFSLLSFRTVCIMSKQQQFTVGFPWPQTGTCTNRRSCQYGEIPTGYRCTRGSAKLYCSQPTGNSIGYSLRESRL